MSLLDLLEKQGSVALHHRNLRIIATGMIMVFKEISPELIKEVFHSYSRSNINLRQAPTFYSRHIDCVHYGENSLVFLGLKVWELVLIEIRSSNSLTEFKRKIKQSNLWSLQASQNLLSSSRLFIIRLIFLTVDTFIFVSSVIYF